jgi:hypothetical protein
MMVAKEFVIAKQRLDPHTLLESTRPKDPPGRQRGQAEGSHPGA